MAFVTIVPGYSWTDGDLVTATRLNTAFSGAAIASMDNIPFGVSTPAAGGFTTLTATGAVTFTSTGGVLFGTSPSRVGADATNWFATIPNNAGSFLFQDTSLATIAAITTTGINNTAVGASTANTGAFTTLGATGMFTYSGGLKYTASDFNKAANTTFSDVTGLSVNVVNTGVYRFVIAAPLSQAGGGGYKVGFGGTATMSAGGSIYQYLTTTVANSIQGNLGLGGFSNAAINAAQSAAFLWHGTFTASATGSVTVQFAQNSATSTSTFGSGSYFEVVRLA